MMPLACWLCRRGHAALPSHASETNMSSARGSARKVITDENDLNKVDFETSEDVDVLPTFDSMKLREDLVRGIYAYGTQ